MKGGCKQEWRQLRHRSADILDEGSKNGYVFKKVIKQVLFYVNTLKKSLKWFRLQCLQQKDPSEVTFTFLSSATVISGLSLIQISFFIWEAPWADVLVSAAVPVPTWVCCCKRDAILGVERGLVLRGRRKRDEKQTPAAEGARRGRHSPWSSLDRCPEWRCWPVRRRGPDPSHWIAAPQVSEASAWRPWRGRIKKHPCRVSSVLKKKERGWRYRRSTPAAGGIQEDRLYPLDQFIHMCFTTLLPRVFQDGTCQLWSHNTFSRPRSARVTTCA